MTPELEAAIAELLAESPESPEPVEENSADAPAAIVVVAEGMIIPAQHHHALATLLKAHGYSLYVTVAASHWPEEKKSRRNPDPPPEHYEVATVLRNPSAPGAPAFWWTVSLAPDAPIDSLVDLYAGADWQEREQWDLLGVPFTHHPNLKRLMLPEDWRGHPLRKDYAIDTPHAPWR